MYYLNVLYNTKLEIQSFRALNEHAIKVKANKQKHALINTLYKKNIMIRTLKGFHTHLKQSEKKMKMSKVMIS